MIDLVITTWINHPARLEFLARTLEALKGNLTAGNDEFNTIVSCESEGMTDEEWGALSAVCGTFPVSRIIRHPEPANLGAHLNFAFALCKNVVRMYVQDDWVLRRPLDISEGVKLLQRNRHVAMVRYYTVHAKFSAADVDGWPEIDLRGFGPYGDNPLLAHRRWLKKTGWFKEGGDPGFHEVQMGSQLRNSGLKAVAPIEVADHARSGATRIGDYYFRHIGNISAFDEKRSRG